MKVGPALFTAAMVALGGCDRAAEAPRSAPPTAPAQAEIDPSRRQAECDQAGQGILQNASIDPAVANAVSASYDPRSKRCNVLLEAHATDPARALDDVSRSLFDGDTGQLLGSTRIEGKQRSALILESGVTDFDEASLYIDRQMSRQ